MDEIEVLEAFMDTADGAFATDAHGTVVTWNHAAAQAIGSEPEAVLGRPCWEVLKGRDPSKNLVCFRDCHVMAMARRGERPSHQDLVVETPGKEILLDISTTLVHGEGGKNEAIVHTFRDVTERRVMETHLRRALEDQPAANVVPPESTRRLTARELQILKLLAAGLSTPAIAKRLAIRRPTVRNHVQSILRKLAVHSKLEAVVVANRYHLT